MPCVTYGDLVQAYPTSMRPGAARQGPGGQPKRSLSLGGSSKVYVTFKAENEAHGATSDAAAASASSGGRAAWMEWAPSWTTAHASKRPSAQPALRRSGSLPRIRGAAGDAKPFNEATCSLGGLGIHPAYRTHMAGSYCNRR
mmetsp:Transcript_27601/g.91653  ORF Transcript_27601/g.91653 Transcript_27601/m.91653 type:complete len:142 (+) Transcript_27601:151-576(+)